MDILSTIKAVFTKSVPDTSPSGKVDKTDTAKLVKTAVFVGTAAGLSYFITNINPEALGPYSPIIMLVLTVGLDFANKMVKTNTEKSE